MPEPITRAQDTVSLDNSPTMAMTTLYGAAVGPIGKDYYLPIFSRFEAAGQATLSWNLSACLYTVNWMIFRRLWGPALVLAGALLGSAVLLVALGLLVLDWPHELIYQLLLACLGLSMLASGLWGNALLYKHCRQAMMTAVADNKTLVQACAQLSQQAATRTRFIRLLAANAVLLSLAAAACAYLMLWGNGSTANALPTPALAASAAEPAASAASQMASAAQAPASAVSAAADTPAASPAEPAPASAPATVASATPGVMPASTPPAAPLAASAAAPVVAPAAAASTPAAASSLPAASSALTASQAAASPAKAVAASHSKVATAASRHAASAPRAKPPAAAKSHASASAHAASRPVAKPAAKPTTAKASQQAKAAPPAKGLFINAGLFANPDNARNALAKLQAAGLPATAQEIDTSQGLRTRIRVGPYAKPAQAEAGIQKIKALGLDAALAKP